MVSLFAFFPSVLCLWHTFVIGHTDIMVMIHVIQSGKLRGLQFLQLVTFFKCSDDVEYTFYLWHYCPHNVCSTVSALNDFPETEFPNYVKLMHQDRDRKLELEFKVIGPDSLSIAVYSVSSMRLSFSGYQFLSWSKEVGQT